MRILEKVAIGAGLVVVGLTVAYRYLLTDEQKRDVHEAADTIRTATQEVSDSVAPLVSNGPTHKEEASQMEANRARTAAQWEALGY